jgi:formylglycine-generating enzyme required for sulfatase activity
MALIPAGTILIGSAEGENEAEDDEKPAHRVTVSKFKLGKTEVTQRQWEAVMGFNPSSFQECGGDCPVEKVSFEEVQAFIERLNAQTGETYRLPTEAEWEYACRAGGDSLYCGGNDLDALAWHGEDGKAGNTTHPAGSKQANAWGLHDMTGNVGEWTCSAYTEHYGDGSELDCATASPQVVVRGGSWFNENPAELRRANREGKYQSDRFVNLGFRLAKDVSGQLPRL